MAAECCNSNCPCPRPDQDPDGSSLDPWQKGYGGKCCGCTAIDYDKNVYLCKSRNIDPVTGKSGTPHWKAPCGCECDPTKIGPCDKPEYPHFMSEFCGCGCTYIYQMKKNPDINPCGDDMKVVIQPCNCGCDVGYDCKAEDPSRPKLKITWTTDLAGNKTGDQDCECVCPLNEPGGPRCGQGKYRRLPHFKSKDCSCYCKHASEEPCTGSTPDFDKEDCSCKCAYKESVNLQFVKKCPPNKPSLRDSTCSCYCYFEEVLYKQGLDCDYYSDGALPDFDADNCQCVCKLLQKGCSGGKVPDPAGKCKCVCPQGMKECKGKCYNACPSGQSRDPNDCVCKNYTQAVLSDIFLP